jgi:SAM-dependent methyltransferase
MSIIRKTQAPLDIVKSHYEPRLDRYEEGHEILDWENEKSQMDRFRIFADTVPLENRSLLDVGCGIADLYAYLQRRHIPVHYTGIDILPKMVERAKKRFPELPLYTGDIFMDSPFGSKGFDMLYCSGIFNLEMGDNHNFLREAIPIFFHHSREWVVFNLLDPDHYVEECRYCFFDPEEVRSWVSAYSGDVRLFRDYVPNDFTIVARV